MKQLQVAVGIIRDKNQNIFLTQRAAKGHMANRWEFPGGKIEAGETPEQALKRELQEETGIDALDVQACGSAIHAETGLQITLHFFLVEEWRGEPYGREGQPQRWVAQQALLASEFPPANAELIARLQSGLI